ARAVAHLRALSPRAVGGDLGDCRGRARSRPGAARRRGASRPHRRRQQRRTRQHVLGADSRAGADVTKILVVEDDPGILRTVADNLRFEKYDVVTAMDGETARELQRSQQPDLIVLDLMLPRLGGLEL